VTTCSPNILEKPKLDVDGVVIGDDDVDAGFNMILLGQFLAALTRKHEGLESCFLDNLAEQCGINSYKRRLKKVEEVTVNAIQTQLTSMAVLLLAHLRVSHVGYQTLVNATSWTTEERGSRSIRVLCLLDTPISR